MGGAMPFTSVEFEGGHGLATSAFIENCGGLSPILGDIETIARQAKPSVTHIAVVRVSYGGMKSVNMGRSQDFPTAIHTGRLKDAYPRTDGISLYDEQDVVAVYEVRRVNTGIILAALDRSEYTEQVQVKDKGLEEGQEPRTFQRIRSQLGEREISQQLKLNR